MVVDRMEWALISAGFFYMGSDNADPDAQSIEMDVQHVDIDYNFWMSKFPITGGWYDKFVEEKKYAPPQCQSWADNNGRCPVALVDHPVTDISWNDAAEFSKWLLGKGRDYEMTNLPADAKRVFTRYTVRLPFEPEWEKAARGANKDNLYPWGPESPTISRANYGYRIGSTTPVNHYSAYPSAYGCFDMAGNVYEWCFTELRLYPYKPAAEVGTSGDWRVTRGGSFNSEGIDLRCAARKGDFYDLTSPEIGFRVVFSLPENDAISSISVQTLP